MTSRPYLPVFVYGTLRSGEKNYPLYLEGRTLEELPATAEGRLYYVADGGYPYILPGGGRVVGELMVLDPSRYSETLQALDRLEDYDPRNEGGSLYLRRKTEVKLKSGLKVEAWAYYWNEPEIRGEWIPEGDFKRMTPAS